MSPKSCPYVSLGEQIEYLVQSLAVINGAEHGAGIERHSKRRIGPVIKKIAEQTNYDEATIHRWRQGRSRPSNEKTIELLAKIGKEEARLKREWGEKLFKTSRYYSEPEAERLVNTIWGLKVIRTIMNNLREPVYTRLFGNEADVEHLLKLLSPQRGAHIIPVDGIGGVGKTTLALEAARRCLHASTGEKPDPFIPTFDAIIFVSAKQQFLEPSGLRVIQQSQLVLRDIFREIARTLKQHKINRAAPEEQREIVVDVLSKRSTLLIVDNLETVQDKDEILNFLDELSPSVKVVITTRERVITHSVIRLAQLQKEDALQLLAHAANEQKVSLSHQEMEAIYDHIGGIPAALIYTIGQIAAGYALERVLERVVSPDGDVARFCFEGSVVPLREQPAHMLLMAAAMFPKRPSRESVIATAGLSNDPIQADEGLARLQQLSLISQREGRYTILPLTREYALAELSAHAKFEVGARERWLSYYLNFVQEHGGEDWGDEWYLKFDRLEDEWENLCSVFGWCAENEKFEELTTFWQQKGVEGFAGIYGYTDDRLVWFEWLIQAAERRGKWRIAVKAMSDKTWTLIWLGEEERWGEIEALLERAWKLREYVSPSWQSDIANNFASLRIRQKNYADALKWLECSEGLLDAQEKGRDYLRDWIPIMARRGEVYLQTKNYAQASECYQQAFDSARSILWQRATIHAQNWLADIAIAYGNLDEAEPLLHKGLVVTERNKDRRYAAFYKRSLAHLEYKRNELGLARRWAEEAQDDFDRLGMRPEAEEMNQLLEELAMP